MNDGPGVAHGTTRLPTPVLVFGLMSMAVLSRVVVRDATKCITSLCHP